MAKDQGFHEYVMSEVFHGMDGITSRSMFGGWGIYKDGKFFAMIADGRLFFKVDSSNKDDYEKHKSSPFVYHMKGGKETTMNYWELPEEIIDSQEELEKWINTSVEIAKKSKK